MRIQRNSAGSTPITEIVLAITPSFCLHVGRKSRTLNVHVSFALHDKVIVSPLMKHAEEIFTAAREGGREDCEVAILVRSDGGIHMLPASGWELEPLRLHHGARAAYRLSRAGGGVRLEARSAEESCVLQSGRAGPARSVLPDFPQYLRIQ